jgi:hypothetical protein
MRPLRHWLFQGDCRQWRVRRMAHLPSRIWHDGAWLRHRRSPVRYVHWLDFLEG